MSEQRPLKIFLCHARADKPAARNLYRYLRSKGMDPWLDEEKLLPGQNWRQEIPKAISASDVIIICLSKNSVDKEGYVQKEIKFALDKALEMPEGRVFIIPARLEECDVPESLKNYQWVELFEKNWNRKLMQSLNLRAANLPGVKQAMITDESSPKLSKPKSDRVRKEQPIERPLPPAESQANGSVDIGGDAKGTTIITGDHNVIVQSPKGEYEALPKKDEPTQTPVGQIANLSQTTARKFNFRKIGIIGLLSVGFIFGLWWLIYYIINVLPVVPLPTPTSHSPTKTATVEQKPPTSTITPPTFTPTPGLGSTKISEKDGMKLVFVPAGEFTMGSDHSVYYQDKPSHIIYLDSFWIDQIEVTNEMYTLCWYAGYCQPPIKTGYKENQEYFGAFEFTNYPVIYVNWNQAKSYCEWTGRRLPTEAEWEKAARGVDGRTYPWGEGIDCQKANYGDCGGAIIESGKNIQGASIYGALDMSGNVWEWTSSLFRPYPYLATDGREDINSSDQRVIRGGAWVYELFSLRTFSRAGTEPSTQSDDLGFRCAFSAE